MWGACICPKFNLLKFSPEGTYSVERDWGGGGEQTSRVLSIIGLAVFIQWKYFFPVISVTCQVGKDICPFTIEMDISKEWQLIRLSRSQFLDPQGCILSSTRWRTTEEQIYCILVPSLARQDHICISAVIGSYISFHLSS